MKPNQSRKTVQIFEDNFIEKTTPKHSFPQKQHNQSLSNSESDNESIHNQRMDTSSDEQSIKNKSINSDQNKKYDSPNSEDDHVDCKLEKRAQITGGENKNVFIQTQQQIDELSERDDLFKRKQDQINKKRAEDNIKIRKNVRRVN